MAGVVSNPSAELYDRTAGNWSATGSLGADGRYYHGSTLLPNGKVLVTGGANWSVTFASAKLYYPTTGASSTPRRCCPTARCW